MCVCMHVFVRVCGHCKCVSVCVYVRVRIYSGTLKKYG